MKKIAIVGRGTAGVYAATHFLRYTDSDIDLYFDDNIKPSAVGEGSTLEFPQLLFENVNFGYTDLEKIHGTVKQGIKKIDWGNTNKEFFHSFLPPSNVGYHFNAVEFQNHLLEKFKKNSRFSFHNTNVITHDDIDSDFVVDCSGRPNTFEDFTLSEFIPVNSIYVEQSPWDGARFLYTYTIARPYGWVFVIPLLNRCSVGYLYNNTINTIEEVKEDIKNIFSFLKLNPPSTSNSFSFSNYYRTNNFVGRSAFNGNASFFLEPLEATSITCMADINRWSFDYFYNNIDNSFLNKTYHNLFMGIEDIISLHYFAGSNFDTEFWRMAKDKAEKCIRRTLRDTSRREMFLKYIDYGRLSLKRVYNQQEQKDYSVWGPASFFQNIQGLGINEKLFDFIEKYY